MTQITNEFILQFELVGRCLLAALCGALIGIERKNRLKEAGLLREPGLPGTVELTNSLQTAEILTLSERLLEE